VPVPQPRKAYLTTEEAAKFLGVGDQFFVELLADYPWCRPVRLGRGRRQIKRWLADDIWCLAHIWQREQSVDQPEDSAGEG
jgi:excisionase family DNA binding protein